MSPRLSVDRQAPTRRALARGLTRRSLFARAGAAGLTWLLLPGCHAPFAPESGPAYAPWRLPTDESRPEWLAVAAAILAASPHNTQPWRFVVGPTRIDLYADHERHLGTMDGLRREMHIGLGCALENLIITLHAQGVRAELELMPEGPDSALVAHVDLVPDEAVRTPVIEALFAAIPRRSTNRNAYAEGGAPPGLDAAFAGLIDDPRIALTWLASDSERARFKSETVAATEAITGDPEMAADDHRWFRTTKEQIDRHRDGPTLDASGNGATTRFFGKMLGPVDRETSGAYWVNLTRDVHTTAGAFAILSSDVRDDRVQQLVCGRVYQRMHLWATDNGISMQPLNQLAERVDREQLLDLEPRFTTSVAEMIGDDARGSQMMFRVGYAWDAPFHSPRRPVSWVAEEAG